MPRQIVCAEASPDTASSISSAMTAAFSGSGSSQGQGISAQAAGFGKAVAESLVQLGERTASIQLLRDGYHRACEAYANGAITDTYALIISRLDEVMVTMMTGELAAGAFGRKLAATSGNAGTPRGSRSSLGCSGDRGRQQRRCRSQYGNGAVGTKTDKPISAANKPPDLTSSPGGCHEPGTQTSPRCAQAATGCRRSTASARTTRLWRYAGIAAWRAAGGINANPDPQIAEKLVEMYDRFMEGNPLKKMVVAS